MIEERFQKIDRMVLKLSTGKPMTGTAAKLMRDEFVVDYTYNSAALDGGSLTYEETVLVLEGKTADDKSVRDNREAVCHRDAFAYVEGAVSDGEITADVIKNINSLVLSNNPDKGTYRSSSSENGIPAGDIEQRILALIEIDRQRRETMHPIVRAALFHKEFLAIAPFANGNGRTARLILNLDLLKGGYPPIAIKFADKDRYNAALADADAMTLLITENIEERMERYRSYLGE